MSKLYTCPPDKIINPVTNRCVLRTGRIGKALLNDQQVPTSTTNNIKCPKRGMMQILGTCWFNSIINSLEYFQYFMWDSMKTSLIFIFIFFLKIKCLHAFILLLK